MTTLPNPEQTYDKFIEVERLPPPEHDDHVWHMVEALWSYAYMIYEGKPIDPMTKEEIDVLFRYGSETLQGVLDEIRLEDEAMKQDYAFRINKATELLQDAVDILLEQTNTIGFLKADATEGEKLFTLSNVYRDMSHWIDNLDTPDIKKLVRTLNAVRVLLYEKYMAEWDKVTTKE